MLELIRSGGILMWPILFCSAISIGIILERVWSLRKGNVVPEGLVAKVWEWDKVGHLDEMRVRELEEGSPLGRVLAAGLRNHKKSRELMKESIEEVGRHVTHELDRFLNSLGIIASITPLMGLLGTVFGMIKVFAMITAVGVGDPSALAEGISEALLTTAAGLCVAIPSLIAHRYLRGHIDGLIVIMEQEALKLVEVMGGSRGQK
ncbi:MAG: MotA/TolQ/ExbB proton channel family protein [Candidatus Eutrophobiaceae bacterium]